MSLDDFALHSRLSCRSSRKLRPYDYDLPETAIAQEPVEPRSSARLLVAVDPGGAPQHGTVADLPRLLRPGDLLASNERKVLPARLGLRWAPRWGSTGSGR